MTFKTLLRSAGVAALVGATTFGVLPAANAQDEGGRRYNNERHGSGDADRAEARAARQQRAQAAPQQRVYQAQQQEQQAGGGWNRSAASVERTGHDWNRGDSRSATGAERAGREWNRRDNTSNDWGQARAARAQAEAQARQEAQTQATQRSGQWQRNRAYSDAARDRTYGSGYRDGYRADQGQDRGQRQNAYSSGYRDGQVTQHYRDGSRYDGYRDDHRRWSNDWRRDNRYNWYGYRNANRSLFSVGSYYSPYRNYRYNRLSIGFYLDSLFYGNRYWINDPWQYRLPAAYGPYRWIRYYDDALLVNIYTGQVEDVVYDFFW